jgi:hypothetical protein
MVGGVLDRGGVLKCGVSGRSGDAAAAIELSIRLSAGMADVVLLNRRCRTGGKSHA